MLQFQPNRLIIILALTLFQIAAGQQEKPENIGVDGTLPVVQPDSQEARLREREQCTQPFRRYSGVCNNKIFKLWGSTGRAQSSLFPLHSSRKPAGRTLPSARFISNAIFKQTQDIYNKRGLNELVVFFGQFLDHTFVTTPAGKKEMPIPIPEDDPIFANFSGHLKFTRSKRVRVDLEDVLGNPAANRMTFRIPTERPVNSLTGTLDLASVYGVERLRGQALRSFQSGMLKVSNGDLLPLNFDGLSNSPFPGEDFFLAGDHRANENPALVTMHTLFVREHNDICRELAQKFGNWKDQKLYQVARKINEAQFQFIVLNEYYPAMAGRRLRRYKGYNANVNPSIIDTFSTAAFRVGHTMVGNKLTMYNTKGAEMPSVPFEKMFFRKANEFNVGVEPFLRGMLRTRAQEIDTQVHDSIRNFLFTGIPVEEEAFDLIALNIQRGRDHAIPGYNQIRRLLKMRPVRTFAGITKNVNLRSALQSVYKSVERVEAWPGMVAEDHLEGSSLGPTMNRLWEMQFAALRDGDRFFYRNDPFFTKEFIRRIPRLRKVFRPQGSVFKDILLRNSELTETEIPETVFFAE